MRIKFQAIAGFIFLATIFGCSEEKFDDSGLLENLGGDWLTDFPYVAYETSGGIARQSTNAYPYIVHKLSITTEGEVLLSEKKPDGSFLVIKSGSVKGISKTEIVFDREMSTMLHNIGRFISETDKRRYRIAEVNDSTLDINHAFVSGTWQYEGFIFRRPAE